MIRHLFVKALPLTLLLFVFFGLGGAVMGQDESPNFEISHHHVAISVPNAEESAGWYQKMLGFEVVTRMNQGDAMSVVHIRRGNCYIELIEYKQQQP
jgi:hypothetical protein